MNGLNPCFSGGWSRRILGKTPRRHSGDRLNPCFSGGWSRRHAELEQIERELSVLILVLVEDGLGVLLQSVQYNLRRLVLILVLVEDGLGVL